MVDFHNTRCSCGGTRSYFEYDQLWKKKGVSYQITNIPAFQCNTCDEVWETAMTVLSKAHLYDEMHKGKLPAEVEFRVLNWAQLDN